MEASEKPQLSIDQASREGTGVVRALDDRLVIERLTVTDERATRVVRERAEAGQPTVRTVSDAIEIGARVLDREDAAAEVDYVRAEFERHAAELRQRLTKSLEEGDEMLAQRISESFDGSRDGSVQSQIAELLQTALEGQRTALLKQFSADDGANPLADFKGAIVQAFRTLDGRQQAEGEENRKRIEALTREVIELKKDREGDSRVAEAEEAGTRKGRSFEERVHGAIERIARSRGDCATHIGGEQAEGGGKKGDTLVELEAAEGPSAGRIVFEAKDNRLSKNQAWAELNQGMAARAAGFGVLVVAGDERVPAGRELLHEYEGNKLIVAVDRDDPDGLVLETAYRLAAARLKLARDSNLQVDAAAVRDAAAEAISTLRQAQAIRSSLTGIKTTSDRARDGLDSMVEAVLAKLERIESLIAAADPD
jgi:flagellar biosynthesis chaperone FliJ